MRKFLIFFRKMQLSNRNIASKSHFFNITMCFYSFDDINCMLQARMNILKAKKIGLWGLIIIQISSIK